MPLDWLISLILLLFFSYRDRLQPSADERERALEVDGGAQQVQMAGVAGEPDVPDPAVAVVALHDGEAALDGGADAAKRLVEPGLPRLQRLVTGRPVHQTVVNAGLDELRPQRL